MHKNIYNLDFPILSSKAMSVTDFLKKKKEENEKRQQEAKYTELATKAIRIAYFNRADFPEQYSSNAKALILSEMLPELEHTTVARMAGKIPVKLHLVDWRVYLEWLYSLPPFQPFMKGAFGQVPNGPSKNWTGIEVPRLSDIMLTLISVIMTPRNFSVIMVL